jgi:hypothetical protein
MSDIEERLKELLDYMDTCRQAGSTALLERAVEEHGVDAHVVFITVKAGIDAGFKDRNVVSLNSLTRIRGRGWPMVFDNSALFDIFTLALARIRSLQKQVDQKEAIITRVRRAVGGGW